MIFSKIINIFLCFLIFFYITHQDTNEKIKKIIELKGKTMGTYWQVKIPNMKIKNIKNLKILIQRNLDTDEEFLSPWKKQSLVYKFNQLKKHKLLKINKKFLKIILTALTMHEKTTGKLDITIGTLINIWGFGTQKKPHNYPSINIIKKNINLSGIQHLQIINNLYGVYLKKNLDGMKINLSTLGEGFAVDHLSCILKKNGIKNYMISIGGTVLVKMDNKIKPKIIAIQKPTDKKQSIQLLIYLKNKSISTSGTYLNYYSIHGKNISHIINPENGIPIKNNLVSVSVISATALEADSWDTGLILLGFKKAKKLSINENLAVCLITKEKNSFFTWVSPQFKKFLILK
ncbi:FAD:protein FMN transferase ApbE [Buchnera aphidicola (Aphis nasturtii)]|uniref:FAD:protein FMN transferase n=1 Tax=Buchnera aphidicola TaxID=9 RepID=UPI0010C2A290|nr:FAD:protein FMN transferase [Buchnera aphidicola]QCI18211.1 FAD:protein FMN transferase ApbE [Buchnera aphidicola (Aphis nasturtii)]